MSHSAGVLFNELTGRFLTRSGVGEESGQHGPNLELEFVPQIQLLPCSDVLNWGKVC